MEFNVPMQRKTPRLETDRCVVEKTIELSKEEYAYFKNHLMEDYDFLVFNRDEMYQDNNGIRHCLLVLGEGSHDGILVEAEGASYARYTASLPYARELMQIQTQLESQTEKAVQEDGYKNLTPEEVEVICAKHSLWLLDAGGEHADFSGCQITGQSLLGKKLNSAVLDGAKLVRVNLCGAELCGASMQGTEFLQCDLSRATVEEADVRNAKFTDCCLAGAFLTHSNLKEAEFHNCNMDYAGLQNCCVEGTIFENTSLAAASTVGTCDDEAEWLDECVGMTM